MEKETRVRHRPTPKTKAALPIGKFASVSQVSGDATEAGDALRNAITIATELERVPGAPPLNTRNSCLRAGRACQTAQITTSHCVYGQNWVPHHGVATDRSMSVGWSLGASLFLRLGWDGTDSILPE